MLTDKPDETDETDFNRQYQLHLLHQPKSVIPKESFSARLAA
jgi:hypothetical protein